MSVRYSLLLLIFFCSYTLIAQQKTSDKKLRDVLLEHRDFVSMPNISTDYEDMHRNMNYVKSRFQELGFTVQLLESETLPVFLAQKDVSKKAKTILYYFHIDGQAVNPDNWDQDDPFEPVLKRKESNGEWATLDWDVISSDIDPEWRIFGRAAADDKAPITMMLTALENLEQANKKLSHNIKILIDPQEESRSTALRSTLSEYKDRYAADYMIIMDGPAHPSNRPTLTFGFRGNSSCSITVYGSKLPQHSGHYGNYVPNPVFTLSHLLSSMKDPDGRVLIENFYDGIELTEDIKAQLAKVPDDESSIRNGLLINEAEKVGNNYQEALQYPSLNIRHIETSWKGPGLKTIIPEYATAYFDVRLVVETDGASQIEKVRRHVEKQGFYVIDREPTDEERLKHKRIATFRGNSGSNAYREDMDGELGQKLSKALEQQFGQEPVMIRTMGGTVPLISVVETLEVPTVIVPMVNMDNNQHNPNENIRIGNIIQGIEMCEAILTMKL